ncbi:protein FAM174C [Labrus mixtus]|uniref:protein FAM174C n=1 Tax=Labrus mixtus TaxID=508554 RepID=UPI0029C0B079|nr:protein FAM174C [Labrus mixtus]
MSTKQRSLTRRGSKTRTLVSAPVPVKVFISFLCTVKMTFHGLLSAVLVPVCWLLVSVAEDVPEPVALTAGTAASRPAVTNSSRVNSTVSGGGRGGSRGLFNGLNVDSSMIQRALYVLIGITMIGVLYFLIRAVRLKRPAQRKKYGLLSNYDDSVEMDGMESEEDDTLYEARSLRR